MPGVWTKEKREAQARKLRAWYATPAGKRFAKKRAAAAKGTRNPMRAAHNVLTAVNGAAGHSPASRAATGRAMLTELAIVGAEARIVELRRELEKLTIFVDHARAKTK